MQDHDHANTLLERCTLEHPLFRSFGEPLFRRSEADATPSMVVRLGDREALLSLGSLQREFGIADDSADGRMLGLIAEALNFVQSLKLGDRLPDEVLTGKASWQPDPAHIQIAATRLKLGLIAWLRGGVGSGATLERDEYTSAHSSRSTSLFERVIRTSGDSASSHHALDADSFLQVANDPAIRRQVQEAFSRAASELGLAEAQEAVSLVEEMAGELAHIEALRERLHKPIEALTSKLEGLGKVWYGNATSAHTLRQVLRLTKIAVAQIADRFDELDTQTGEVIAMLRNIDAQRAFIRSNRDWLYRSQRAWQPILEAWEKVDLQMALAAAALVRRTYQFLAPRFMPVTEWTLMTRPQRSKPAPQRQMAW